MNKPKKLQLKRETLTKLTREEQSMVQGGVFITLGCGLTRPGICGPTMA